MLRKIIVVAGYVLATVVVVFGTVLLVAYGNGYYYDFKTHTLHHRGLVILNSVPTGADITMGHKFLKHKTPYRLTLDPGSYDFTVTKDGYRTWHRRVDAISAQATLVQYIIMLPVHLKVNYLQSYPVLGQVVTSRDHHRLALNVPSGESAGVWSFDTQSHSQTRIYQPAVASDSQPAEAVQVLGWSDDNSHLLAKSQVGDKVSYLILAANGSDQPINLTNQFQLDFAGLSFDPNNWRQLYWVDGTGALRRIDVGSQTVSAALADHVLGFKPVLDRGVFYVDNTRTQPELMLLDRGGHKQKLADKLPASDSYQLDYANYIGTPELAVTMPASHTTLLYKNIIVGNATTQTLPAVSDQAQFNGDGRFLLMSSGDTMASYDNERDRTQVFPAFSAVSGLNWFDNYHVVFNSGGKIVLAEYDGQNAAGLTKGDNWPAFASADEKNVLVPSATSSGTIQLKAVQVRQ